MSLEILQATRLEDLKLHEIVAIVRSGSNALEEGRWHLLGHVSESQTGEWSQLAFGRAVEGLGPTRYYKTEYSSSDPSQVVSEKQVSLEEVENLPQNILMGSGSVESFLSHLATRTLSVYQKKFLL